jgi:hypothetical protein
MNMMMPTPHEVDELVDRIRLLLRGQGPDLQGAALADLVAMFFAGHHPAMREEMIGHWTDAMRGLIPINEALQFEHVGKPEGWDRQ